MMRGDSVCVSGTIGYRLQSVVACAVFSREHQSSRIATRHGFSMSAGLTGGMVEVAHKWRALAERRRAHYIELYHSGRWKHYYGEEQFMRRLREAIRTSDRWAEIAPPPAEAPLPRPVVERTAA